jgi:hypothetical protein
VAHQGETFSWQYLTFDVTRLAADVAAGLVASVYVAVDAVTIDRYSRETLNLDGTSPTKVKLDMAYAAQLDRERLAEPLLIVDISDAGPAADAPEWAFDFSNAPRFEGSENNTDELGAGLEIEGALEWDAASRRLGPGRGSRPANAILVDGNHRIACAFSRRIEALPGRVVRLRDASRYLLD